MLEQLILIIHALAALAIIGLIMLQQGKGAEMGASFGSGASQTVLGVQGGGNLLTHSTAILAAVFFLTSLSLGYYAKQHSKMIAGLDDSPVVENMIEVPTEKNSEIPVSAEANTSDAAAQVPAAVDAAEVPSSSEGVSVPEVNKEVSGE